MAEEYKKAVSKGKDEDNIIRFNDLNAEIFEDIILSTYWSLITLRNKEKLHLVWLKTAKRPNIRKGIAG